MTAKPLNIAYMAVGIWNSVFIEKAEALARLGHRVVVYTEDRRAPGVRDFTRFEENDVEFWVVNDQRRHPLTALADKLFKPLLGRRFFTALLTNTRFIRAHRDFDWVMVEWDFWPGLFAAIARLFVPFRWVVGVHDASSFKTSPRYPGQVRKAWIHHAKQWVYRQADLVLANSHVTRDALVESGCPPEKIRVLPLYVTRHMIPDIPDLGAFRREARRQVVEQLGLPQDCGLLMTMSRLTPVKGLELAVEALALVLKEDPRAVLVICGEDRRFPGIGSYRACLESLAQRLGVADRLIFAGLVPTGEVKRFLAAADLHLAPSVIDTFNYAVVEAAAVETFSLTSDKVGAAHWMAEAGAGRIVASRSPDAWAAEILTGLAKEINLEHLPTAGRTLVAGLTPLENARQLTALLSDPARRD